jgi:hypothetical protein
MIGIAPEIVGYGMIASSLMGEGYYARTGSGHTETTSKLPTERVSRPAFLSLLCFPN